MDCHIAVDDRMDLRPKKRKTSVGDAFMSASTIGAANPKQPYQGVSGRLRTTKTLPLGLIAGAKATNKFTLSFRYGCTPSAANAWAVPWLNPI